MTQTRLEVRTHPVGTFQMNAYALVCPHTNESALVDPGADPAQLLALLEGTTPRAILLTHAHGDHIGALDEMRTRLQVPLLAHGGPYPGNARITPDRVLTTGDAVSLGAHTLDVVHTPGHSPDMLSFLARGEPTAIVGDTLFDGGPGRTRSPQEFATTLATLRDIVLHWDDDRICYPGHGPAFRLGDRRAAIARFAAHDHGSFFGDAEWDM